jgi:hypothetical protein
MTTQTDPVALRNVELLLCALTPYIRNRYLARALPPRFRKAEPHEIALAVLTGAVVVTDVHAKIENAESGGESVSAPKKAAAAPKKAAAAPKKAAAAPKSAATHNSATAPKKATAAPKKAAATPKSDTAAPKSAAAAPASAATAEKQESIKEELLRTGGTLLTEISAAVSAESVHSGDVLIQHVIARAEAVLKKVDKDSLTAITPGSASGKYWVPAGGRGTSGSAAYSRYKTKYHRLGYKTLVPLYYDERPCANEDIWLKRKDVAGAIEKALHRHFKSDALYSGSEGGKEPAYSSTTRFYVYLAIK